MYVVGSMGNYLKFIVLALFPVLFFACDSSVNKEKEIEGIPVDFELVRFDKIFSEAQPDDLPELKKTYPQFFPEQFPDSIWLNMLQDTLQFQINEEVLKVFPETTALEDELTALFQHIKYYIPEFKIPKVYTVTSDVDYRTKVVANDSLLVLELDTYLGKDHLFYEGLPKYISQNLSPSQIVPDVALMYGRSFVAPPHDRTLVAQMIYYGKLLYLSDLWIPNIPDYQKIGYTEDDLNWAVANEEEIWKYFIEKEYLYDTNTKLQQRFIDPAPFSKFNLEIDNESPGMIGRWVGWQIVRSYMENNDTSLFQLMVMPAETIFKNSKYKPRK